MQRPKAILLKTEYIAYVEFQCINPTCRFIMKEYRNLKNGKSFEADCPKCDLEMILEIPDPLINV